MRQSIGVFLIGMSLLTVSMAQAQSPGSSEATAPDGSVYPFAPPPPEQIQLPPPPVTGVLGSGYFPASGPVEANVHVGFEGLIRWVNSQRRLPVITSGPANDPIPAGVGFPNTRILVDSVDANPATYGGRLTLGYNVESRNDYSLQGSGYWMSQSRLRAVTGTGAAGTNVLARPFFNVIAGGEDADPAAFPQIASGRIGVRSDRDLFGGDGYLRYLYIDGQESRMVLMAGLNFIGYTESVQFEVNSDDLPGLGVAGNSYYLRERFSARNYFYTAAVGAESEFRIGPVFVKGTGKVSLGVVNQEVERSPYIQITEPSGIVSRSSDRALYISPASAGRVSRNVFAVVPEGAIKLGIDFSQFVQLSAGYSVQYFNSVIRPADQIDRNVIVQPVGTPDTFVSRGTTPPIRGDHLFIQGLDVTLRLSF